MPENANFEQGRTFLFQKQLKGMLAPYRKMREIQKFDQFH